MKNDITKTQLLRIYKLFKSYSHSIFKLKQNGHKIRMPNFNECISENIIRLILKKKNIISTRACKNGDLFSDVEKKQECKTFSSTGPISFGPNTEWSVIYFLDATAARENDVFVLHRTNLTNVEFNEIIFSKSENYSKQCKDKRRPRISWNNLFPQIKDNTEQIFSGSIYEI